jgi:hypothetical protein
MANQKARKVRQTKKKGKIKVLKVAPPKIQLDIVVADLVGEGLLQPPPAMDRLSFDGYRLRWIGSDPSSYTAFSGREDESVKESVKDEGPTPQGNTLWTHRLSKLFLNQTTRGCC